MSVLKEIYMSCAEQQTVLIERYIDDEAKP